jgi:hypothetical protein|tara:strand:+ start:373 stop:717 length:345 start_codon:yes stop_codon:yes gene_type:complete
LTFEFGAKSGGAFGKGFGAKSGNASLLSWEVGAELGAKETVEFPPSKLGILILGSSIKLEVMLGFIAWRSSESSMRRHGWRRLREPPSPKQSPHKFPAHSQRGHREGLAKKEQT